MDKMEAVIKKVNRYDLKYNEHKKKMESLGVNEGMFWASFPAGSEERKVLIELERIQNDLSRARAELVKREAIETKKADKTEPKIKKEESSKWMQSGSGMWHKFGGVVTGDIFPSCQSYNLDRPNPLSGEPLEAPPRGAKVCKKCSGKNSGSLWK